METLSQGKNPESASFREVRICGGDAVVSQAIARSSNGVGEASLQPVEEQTHVGNRNCSQKQIHRDAKMLVSISEDEPLDEKCGMQDTDYNANVIEWRSWALQVNSLLQNFHQKLALVECRLDHLTEKKFAHLENRLEHLGDCWLQKVQWENGQMQQELDEVLSKVHRQNDLARCTAVSRPDVQKSSDENRTVDTSGSDWEPLVPETKEVDGRFSPRSLRECDQLVLETEDICPLYETISEGCINADRSASRITTRPSNRIEVDGRDRRLSPRGVREGDQRSFATSEPSSTSTAMALDHTEAENETMATSEERRGWGKPGFLRRLAVDEMPAEPPTQLLWAGSSHRANQLLQTGVTTTPLELENEIRRNTKSMASRPDPLSPAAALRRLNSFLDDVGATRVHRHREMPSLGSPGSDSSEMI